MRGSIYCSIRMFSIFGADGKGYGKLPVPGVGARGASLVHLGCLLGTSWVLWGTTWPPRALGGGAGNGQGAYGKLAGSLREAYGN